LLNGGRWLGVRKAFGGFEGGGIDFHEAIDQSQLQNAFDHSFNAGKPHRSAGLFETRKAVDYFSEASAVELGDSGEIEDDAGLVMAEKFVERQIELFAFDAHLERALQFENDNAGLQLFLDDFHVNLPFPPVLFKDFDRSLHSGNYPDLEPGSRTRGGLRCLGFIPFVGKLTDDPDAIGKRIDEGIAPTSGKKWAGALVDYLVRLREEAREHSRRGRGEFLDGDLKTDIAIFLTFFEGEQMELSKFLGIIFLSKFPIAHKPLRRARLPDVRNERWEQAKS
jgi:hypothetical protein